MVQGLKRIIPFRLSFNQAGVLGFRLCSMMFTANLGAMMPAQPNPLRYIFWSFSSGNFSKKRRTARQYSSWVTSSPMASSTPQEKPTPAGPSMQRTLASLFQLLELCLRLAVLRVKVNSPLEYNQLCRLEQPGPGEMTTTRGSLEGLFSEGVQTQQSAFPEWMSRQPAQKGLTKNPTGRRKVSTQSPSSTLSTVTARSVRRINHLIDIDIDRYYKSMILLLVLSVGLVVGQVSHEPIIPKVVTTEMGRTIRTVPSNTAFREVFPLIGYDIGGKVYETHQGLVDANLFDQQVYRQSTSCTLYKSQLNLKVITDIDIDDSQTVQSIVTADPLEAIFAIVSNTTYDQDQKQVARLLVAYHFTDSTLTQSTHNITVQDLGLNSSEVFDILLVMVNNQLIVTDGVKLVWVNTTNFSNHHEIGIDQQGVKNHDYSFAEEKDLLKVELCHYSKRENLAVILVTWNAALRVYHLEGNLSKGVLHAHLLPPENSLFTDAIPDHGKYWALAEGQFVAFRPAGGRDFSVDIVKLESDVCFSLNKFKTTLHMICQEGGLNYVSEFFLNESFVDPSQALRLNRYYTDIDDAKLLFHFGGSYNPKLIISGDDDLMIVPYAINRQVLLASNYAPRGRRLRSLGVQLIHSLPSYSNFTHSYAIGVGQFFISLFIMVEEQPEMQCRVMRTSQNQEFNILVQLNSTSCLGNGDWEQLQSICTYYFPFNVYASLVEVDAANHKTIVATVLLLLLALAIFVVGCGFYCKANIERASAEIRKKIEVLKRKKGNKPI